MMGRAGGDLGGSGALRSLLLPESSHVETLPEVLKSTLECSCDNNQRHVYSLTTLDLATMPAEGSEEISSHKYGVIHEIHESL